MFFLSVQLNIVLTAIDTFQNKLLVFLINLIELVLPLTFHILVSKQAKKSRLSTVDTLILANMLLV